MIFLHATNKLHSFLNSIKRNWTNIDYSFIYQTNQNKLWQTVLCDLPKYYLTKIIPAAKHLSLIYHCSVMRGKDSILSEMSKLSWPDLIVYSPFLHSFQSTDSKRLHHFIYSCLQMLFIFRFLSGCVKINVNWNYV